MSPSSADDGLGGGPPTGRGSAQRTWIWAEHREGGLTEATWELLGEGRELAAALGGTLVLAGAGLPEPLPLAALGGAGVARVHLAGPPPPGAEAEAGAAVLAAITAAEGPPAAVLVPATGSGSALAPRAAIRLGAACLDDCLGVAAAGDGLRVRRWACDDRLHEEWLVTGRPLVATLRPQTRGRPAPAEGPAPELVRHPAPELPARVRHLGELAGEPGSVPLAEAPRIVAAGLGIGGRETLAAVEELAGLLGASVGATRPLTDRGWVPFERQIGTTGQVVSPRLHIALGVSGALQHLSGIIGAETVVAVNTDRSCPMMARATLAVAGDVADVLPLLLARLRERAGAGAAP
ncbi:MAG TPA: electron transfer flavoprotein subunit alpha/FixB family protein [Candidatus Dormibacteraeota bacterium]|nr:electron transfer flavoprotein subunit alpha/FixB family protein [Candidatus Dormibacteraeota bacterium]